MNTLLSSGRLLALAALTFTPLALHAQCTTNNADCVGADCYSTTLKVEYTNGTTGSTNSNGSINVGSFQKDFKATNAVGTTSSLDTLTTSVGGRLINGQLLKHAVWTEHKRSELSTVDYGHPLKDSSGTRYNYWYGWSYYIPNVSNWTTPVNPLEVGDTSLTQYIGQWRFSNLSGCATMLTCNNTNVGGSGHHLTYVNGRLFLTLTINDNSCDLNTATSVRLRQIEFDLGPAVKDQWMDFMMQAKWSAGTDGTLKLWIQKNNGGYTQVLDYNGPNWFVYNNNTSCSTTYRGLEASAPNWQVGLYASNDAPLSSDPRVIYSDEPQMRRTLCNDTTTSDGWTKTLPSPGSVNTAAPVAAQYVVPVDLLNFATATTGPRIFTTSANTATDTTGALLTDKVGTEYDSIASQALFAGLALNAYAQASIYVPEAGTYNVNLGGKVTTSRAIATLTVNGVSLGSWDQYSATTAYGEKNYGTVALNAGLNTFRWTTTGKTGSANVYQGVTKWVYSLDALDLVRTVGSVPAAAVIVEMEARSFTVNSDSITITSDSSASGGQYVVYNSNAIGDTVQTTITVPTAGNYKVTIRSRDANTRGNADFYVNNVKYGSIYQYNATTAFKDYLVPGIIPMVAGSNTLKWVIIGKNASSTGYKLTFDKLTLTP
jgi:hypothetical protein